MNIDLDHLHFWMCAIRDSDDSKRTLDAFWRGQIDSKIWLIENLKPFVDNNVTIDIHGGWVGVLSSLIFQSEIPVKFIRSIDIDPSCQPIATTMNKPEEMQGRFLSVTADMCEVKTDADIVINTSCEHITQDSYDQWIQNIPKSTLIVLQSNNYRIDEHIRTSETLAEFKEQSHIDTLWEGSFDTGLYTRFMLIGTV